MKKISANKNCPIYQELLILFTEARHNIKVTKESKTKKQFQKSLSQTQFGEMIGLNKVGTISQLETAGIAIDFIIYHKYMIASIIDIEDKKKIMNFIAKHYPDFLSIDNQAQYLKDGKYKDFLQTLCNHHYFCNNENAIYEDMIKTILSVNNVNK